ncbi:hypothetical protein PHMEG_00018998, partial [Phytophthora megakarya]
QLSCLICCRVRSHDNENLPRNRAAHTRHGNKTRYQCNVCRVPLCKVERRSDRSCIDLFHADSELPNSCKLAPETQASHFRPPPPENGLGTPWRLTNDELHV